MSQGKQNLSFSVAILLVVFAQTALAQFGGFGGCGCDLDDRFDNNRRFGCDFGFSGGFPGGFGGDFDRDGDRDCDCSCSPRIKYLPVPKPFPIRVPVPRPCQPKPSVTIPNIILALLPPNQNKQCCSESPRPCGCGGLLGRSRGGLLGRGCGGLLGRGCGGFDRRFGCGCGCFRRPCPLIVPYPVPKPFVIPTQSCCSPCCC